MRLHLNYVCLPTSSHFARAFDKDFSLGVIYPKGHGGLFRQWMKVNYPGELLWHVERAASGGRQDVASMAALAIFWNRHYCIDNLDEILTYGDAGAKDNILANNLWILLSSVEMVAVARLWSILHIAIIMSIRWLAGKVHELEGYGWGPKTLGKVLDKLKDDLETLIDQTNLIHDESFMMGIMDPWANELKTLPGIYGTCV